MDLVASVAVGGLLFWLTRAGLRWCERQCGRTIAGLLVFAVWIGSALALKYLLDLLPQLTIGPLFKGAPSFLTFELARQAVWFGVLGAIYGALFVLAQPAELKKE